MEKITNVFVPVPGLETRERAVAVGAAMGRRRDTSPSLVALRAPHISFHSEERYLTALADEQHVSVTAFLRFAAYPVLMEGPVLGSMTHACSVAPLLLTRQ